MSLCSKWLSTTLPTGSVAFPLGHVLYVPGAVASTATAEVSVTFCRSSNAYTCVALSSAPSFTEAGGEFSLVTTPLVLVINAPATVTVELNKALPANTTKRDFFWRTTPPPGDSHSRNVCVRPHEQSGG